MQKSFLALFIALCLSLPALATAYTSTGTGSWTSTSSWLPAGVPDVGDDVTILAGHVITMNANPGACNNLTIWGTLTWANARTLNVGGNLRLNSGGAITGTATGVLNVTGAFAAAAGAGTIGQNTMTVSSNSTFIGVVTYTSATGTQNFNGPVSLNNGSGIAFNAAKTVNFGGAASTSGTVTFSGSAVGNLNMASTLNVPASSVLNIGSTNLSVTGATTDAGTILYTNANGAKTFGNVTIASGGLWDCSGSDMAFVMAGNLTNNGTFNASATVTGPNEYKFTSATATIAGTLTIPNLSVASGAVLTNTNVLTISDSLYGSGKYFQGAGSTLLYTAPKLIVVSTFNPSAGVNLVDYSYAGAQTVYGGNSVTYSNLNISNSGVKMLGGNLNVGGNLTVQGTATLDVNVVKNYSINAGGNWTITSTSATPFLPQQGMVTFNGSSGTQAISTVVTGGQTFYNVAFNNTSVSSPGIATSVNLNVTHNTTFTQGSLDLKGRDFIITGDVTNTTDQLNGGLILTSVAGSTFKVSDPNSNKTTNYMGTQIGTATAGVTISDSSGRIQFENFTQYGTANFVKTLNADDIFGGGNVYHGPVTFTAAPTASRWRMGDNMALPDTFYNATFNALATGGSNNNFIVGANSIGNAFYGTTTMTSVTDGGFFICRQNGGGNASARFYGPVIANIGLTGNMTFADAGSGNVNSVTFDNTITLNSTSTSTGFFHFANNNAYGTIILNSGAQFLTGSINGQTNVYLCNLTQLGTLTQTVNTAGSTGALYVGGTTSLPSYSCTFNGPCNFTADTAGYFVGNTFNGSTKVTVNDANANGYIIGNTMNSDFVAIVGNIRFQKNTFNGSTSLQHTSGFNSTSNGGNTFNGLTRIINSGSGTLRQGGYTGLGDTFNNDVAFLQSSASAIIYPAYGATSTFAANISVAGIVGAPITFASNSGNVTINGSGTQTFSNGSAPVPQIVNLTMAKPSATSILQFSFSPTITGTLAMNQGLIDLNGNTLTLGTSTGSPGTLSYSAGWAYGGTFTRWFPKASMSIPSTTGLFPMGTSPSRNAFRPLWFGYSTNLTTGGTMSVKHDPTGESYTPISYFDASWGSMVKAVSIAAWQISTGNGLAPNGSTGQLRYGGNGFGQFSLPDLNASLASSAVGTFGSATNATVDLEVNRTGLSSANLNNTWYIGIRDLTFTTLPVQLVGFDARVTTEGNVELTWSTSVEVNNRGWEVERSQDGVVYAKIAEVASNVLRNYSAVDVHPFAGRSFYRLRQVDNDGGATYSRVVSVDVAARELGVQLYPNPARTNVRVTFTAVGSGRTVMRIVDAGGKVVADYNNVIRSGVNTFDLSVAGYRPGMYFLQVEGKTVPFSVF
ncbi:MAG: T9SS type A sorting domain-containing protein [Bacteroidetes bacterium]|nr:T9SS type A sorting domain-containing protein [Bacteroidota bacterium]